MGYNIRLRDADFRIDAEDTRAALDAIRRLMDDETADRGGYSSRGENHFAYLKRARPEDWDYLKEAMRDWRFPVELDDDRNVVDIRFSGEKAGDERQLFEAIAPHVKEDSYLEFEGANGEIWRLSFTNGGVERRDGDVIFE